MEMLYRWAAMTQFDKFISGILLRSVCRRASSSPRSTVNMAFRYDKRSVLSKGHFKPGQAIYRIKENS